MPGAEIGTASSGKLDLNDKWDVLFYAVEELASTWILGLNSQNYVEKCFRGIMSNPYCSIYVQAKYHAKRIYHRHVHHAADGRACAR